MRRTTLQGRVVTVLALLLFLPALATSHCDTMNGPVVKDARLALEKGDITPVLKWIKKENEVEIISLFEKTRIVRSQSVQARELADMYFFETVVRVHRAGEGAPYTGLKPEGTPVEHGIEQADRAVDERSVDKLVHAVTADVAAGLKRRFDTLMETQQRADRSVAAGRDYVAAYVEFIHYVERIQQAVSAGGHAEQESPEHLH